jgi:dihydropteroate synthase
MNAEKLISGSCSIGTQTFKWGTQTYLMGILNITPDSFSGDGLLKEGLQNHQQLAERVLDLAYQAIEAGAHILDVGGESTRPGSAPVSLDDEMERVLPIIRLLASQTSALISIDTYKSQVAEAALKAGAHMINDIWGLHADPQIAAVAASFGVPVILMHNRSKPSNAELVERLGGRYVGMTYQNLLEDVCNELMQSVEIAHAAGVKDEQIILDPGIGFGKTVEQNLELVNRLDVIRALGYPVLLGPSRKSFIGFTLDLPADQRMEGTAAAVAVGITRNADIVRVHDVASISRVVRMTDAIVRQQAS